MNTTEGFAEAIRNRAAGTVSVCITEELVGMFARLSGDRSSLHVDEAFGRRSLFRRNVAHGMLPVLMLLVLPVARVPGWQCRVRSLGARFAKPCFAGDALLVSCSLSGMDEAALTVDLEFAIRRLGGDAEVTTGTLTLGYRRTKAPTHAAGLSSEGEGGDAAGMESVACVEAGENAGGIHDFAKGDSEALALDLRRRHARALFDLLSAGVPDGPGSSSLGDWLACCRTQEMLVASAVSTLVGMRLPGRNATFMDFSVSFGPTAMEWGEYYLSGTVSHVSVPAATLRAAIGVAKRCDGVEAASGALTVRVNPASLTMPSVEALRAEALDLGIAGRVVLVTGASRGIGETTAKLFAVHGAKVVVNYNKGREDGERVASEIRASGGDAIAIQGDVTDRQGVKEMVAGAVTHYGRIDVLVNNAAHDFLQIPFMELTWGDMQREIDVTIQGAFHCAQEVIPLMIQNGGGRIINVSTVATDVPPRDSLKYIVAKSGLTGLTRSLAVDFGRHNILVNAVCPSMAQTDLTQHVPRMAFEKARRDTPVGRVAEPLDVARTILFLASSLSSYTSGQRVNVAGGGLPLS